MLAALVGGMLLPGEDELSGPAARGGDAREPIGVGKDQLRALVAREPPRVADRQRVLVEHRPRGDDARGGALGAPPLARALADEVEQVRAERLPRGPELLVGNRQDAVDVFRAVVPVDPGGAAAFVEQWLEFR